MLHEEEKDKATVEFLILIIASVWNDQGFCPMFGKSCLLLADGESVERSDLSKMCGTTLENALGLESGLGRTRKQQEYYTRTRKYEKAKEK